MEKRVRLCSFLGKLAKVEMFRMKIRDRTGSEREQ